MTVKEFRALAWKSGKIRKIPVSMIRIIEKVHYNSDLSQIPSLNKDKNKLLVILHHDNKDCTYNLITGWKDYTIAIRDGIKTIDAVLVNSATRDKFYAELSDSTEWVTLPEIIIPSSFKKSPPKEEKLHNTITNMKEALRTNTISEYLDTKPITISKNNTLIDGYTRYLALKFIRYQGKFPVIRKD